MKTEYGHAPMNTITVRAAKLALVLAISLAAGCSTFGSGDSSERRSGLSAPANPIVVKTGSFQKAVILDFYEERGVKVGDAYTCPITSLSMTPGAIEDGAGESVANLFRKSLASRGFSVLGPDETAEAVKKATAGDAGYTGALGLSVGKTLEADLVIIGVVARYEDRVGGSFSVDRPASVAFSMAVINVAEGRIVWKARFDKAQKDLFSNLLDIRTFVRGGMTWQTSGQLAELGAEDMMDRAELSPSVNAER